MGDTNSTTRIPYALLSELLRAGRLATDAILEIHGAESEDPALRLRMVGGLLVDLETPGETSLLTRSVGSSPELRERDLKRIRRDIAQSGADLGQRILEVGLLDDQEIARCVITSLDRELSPLLQQDEPRVKERPDAHLAHGLLGCIDLSLPIEDALLRAATALGRWDIARELPLLRDVCGATSAAMEVFREPERFPEDAALLERFDGRLDIAEVIESGECDPWESLERCRALVQEGFLEAANPVQLFQMGNEEERLGAFAKALRLFQHAEELGLDDFDIGHKLAEVYQKVGRTDEALHHFLAFAEKCVGQFRIEDTISAYSQILELDPENLEIQEKYLSLLARYGRGDEALGSGVELAKRLQESGDDTRARALLEQLVEQAENNEEVLRLYRDICLSTADPEGAASASKKLGQLYLQREEFDAALEVFQELFFQIGDDVSVRTKLVEIHYRLGNTEQADEHLAALHERSGWSSHQPSEESIAFHRKLLDLGVENSAITAWLSEAARGQESREDSAHYLLRHRDLLREAGDLEGARLAAAELVRMRPEDLEATRTLSEIERRCGHVGRAGVVLEELATRLVENDTRPPAAEWRAFLEEILSVAPTSTVTRRYLLETIEEGAEPELSDRLAIEAALLAVIAGDLDAARTAIARVTPPPPISSVLEMCAGVLGRGGRDLGEEPAAFFRRAAQHAADTGDRGILLDQIQRLEAVAPDDPELSKLRQAAERARHSDGSSMSRSPQVVKSSISGITEKLRGLKDGGGNGGGTRKASGGVNAALARLKGLQGGGAAGAGAAASAPMESAPLESPTQEASMGGGPGDETPLPPPPAPSAAGGGVNAALAKLRGLKGLGGDPTPTATSSAPTAPVPAPAAAAASGSAETDDPAPLPPPPAPDAAGGGVNAALARLKGLKGLGAAAAAGVADESPPPSIEENEEVSGDESHESASDDSIVSAEATSEPPEPNSTDGDAEADAPAANDAPEASSVETAVEPEAPSEEVEKPAKDENDKTARVVAADEEPKKAAPRRRRRSKKKKGGE